MVTLLSSLALSSHPSKNERPFTALEKCLRLYRTEQAYIRAIPAYAVFGDKLLHQITNARPTTLKLLHAMKGIGSTRFENYGRDIVRLINLNAKSQNSSANTGRKGRIKVPRPRPRPKPHPKPRPKPKPKPKTARRALKAKDALPLAEKRTAPTPRPTSVYILELENDHVYVGSSQNVERRIAQHIAGSGAAFTRLYKPTGVRLPRLGNVEGCGDAAERDETLRYMFQRGIPKVRGWKFTQNIMPFKEFAEAEDNIRELFDLCRRCGRAGHFMSRCNFTSDRWGRACTDR